MSDIPNCQYDYANKCDCSEDDKCGCDYPNNIPHDYSLGCLTEKETIEVATEAPMVKSVWGDEINKSAKNDEAK